MDTRIKLYNIFKLKCPRCYKGNLFTNRGLFVFNKILDMPQNCSHCNQDFKIEPGFYSAALWISYPIVLIVFIPLLFLGLYLNENYEISFKILLPVLVILCFLLQIPIMRISRAILIHLTINYVQGGKRGGTI
ncbi:MULTISPECIES: DUF983 domain-containing protein [unclassified Flavobacterium]|jgi:uncharacterized protein (DUF983 family)|uniref:DUF983 domain-containing protein n=1 Tax=unclassified Flavobacterium TaxID=196869 RepID=UPI000A3D84BE|nr:MULTISPECIES: DUF983 domain-containing protein [unclassified Flavobacterium]MEA9415823.1 DUF983 domain-containing protein [Flavobacterium sp. PL02]OUL60080.1 DUF983 domain-containing protein [Flavobacterium sp. AJR]